MSDSASPPDTADGRTFAMVRRNTDRHIVVIQDLPGLLRRLRGTSGTGR